MANDRPTSLRMGFGFEEARGAGAPYQAPPTVGQMNSHIRERQAEKELRSLVELYPHASKFVLEVIKANSATCSAQVIAFFVKFSLAKEAKSGFTVTGHDGRVYKSNKVLEIYGDQVRIVHEGRPFTLQRHYVKSLVIH